MAMTRARRRLITAVGLVTVIAVGVVVHRRAPEPAVDSAHRIVFWVNCTSVLAQSDAQLRIWHDRGVGGFVCTTPHLYRSGSNVRFTGDPTADLGADGYKLQRALTETRIVERLAALDMKVYLGFPAVNYENASTPFSEWFDDAGWAEITVPAVRDLAAAAHRLGMAGIAIDQELYPQRGGARTATWTWRYPGGTHDEATVRAAARARGRQLQTAIQSVFPGIEIVAYDVALPGAYGEALQRCVNDITDAYRDRLDIDFWDGIASVEGYERIRFYDASFYKQTMRELPWDTALRYNASRVYATLSQRWTSWPKAADRVAVTPFAWIDGDEANEGPFTAPRLPDYVADQLAAFRRWGVDGEFGVFAYAGLDGFDYGPYVEGLRQAAQPGPVDTDQPDLTLDAADTELSSPTASLSGSTGDLFAIRFVRWQSDRGAAGTATLRWTGDEGCATLSDGPTRWEAAIPLEPGPNVVTIVSVDIKGHETSRTVTLRRDA